LILLIFFLCRSVLKVI